MITVPSVVQIQGLAADVVTLADSGALTGAEPPTGGNVQTSEEVPGVHGLLFDQLIVLIDKLHSESGGIHGLAGQVEVQNRVLSYQT